ncbi:MAG: hypothetical protein H7A01_18060 [Hahellaceae bacterium]|nr:hypothetical protein [Hahellaceae bacterium]
MKGLLIKAALCCAALAQPAVAEFSPLNETEMSNVSGQAGLSIELAANVSIGEIAYEDKGYLLIQDFSLGGIGGTPLDNLLITIDVAGDNEVINYGFSRMAAYADAGMVDSSNADVADAIAKYNQGGGQYGKAFNDGDLVIHMDSVADGVASGNSSNDNINAYGSAIDFELGIGAFSNVASNYTVGSMVQSGNSMFSNITMQGYLGPVDVVIRNATGSTTLASNITAANSRTEIEAHFAVTDLDVDWDSGDLLILFNFDALKLRDVKIHNNRGDDTLGHFGMASVKATIGEAMSNITGVTGLGIYDVELRTDIDMPHFQFGSAPSIGEVYLSDFVITADMVVYGH